MTIMDVLFDILMSPATKAKRSSSAPPPLNKSHVLPLPAGLDNSKYNKLSSYFTVIQYKLVVYIIVGTITILLFIVYLLSGKLNNIAELSHTKQLVSNRSPSNDDINSLIQIEAHGTTDPNVVESSNRISNADIDKLEQIKQSFLFAYHNYVDRCIDSDDLNPVDGTCTTWVGQHNTLIDSLSTLYIMNLTDEFNYASTYITNNMTIIDIDKNVSFFETTIRVLGGLLSAYSTTHNTLYMKKSVVLADRMLVAFDEHTGLPSSNVNLAQQTRSTYDWSQGSVMLAELGTFQLEYYYLTHVTGDIKYKQYADTVYQWFINNQSHSKDGLYPVHIDTQHGTFKNQEYFMGGMADSFYEYLLKTWLLTGKTNNSLKQLYLSAMSGIFRHMYHQAGHNAWLADITNGKHEKHQMQHLACFIPGLLYLGVAHGVLSDQPELEELHKSSAIKLTQTCYNMYTISSTGLAPESVQFNPNTGDMSIVESSYKLRPEVLESITILYYLTGDQQYRQMGWNIYQSIEKYCRVQYGYSGLKSCNDRLSYDNRMESYYFAETMKYLYLLFSDTNIIRLTGEPGEYSVFNTEAHQLQSWAAEEFG